MKRAIIAIAVVLAALGGDAYAKTIYVDGRATGANNGTCWADAYIFLQDVLTDADQSEKPVYVRVAQGVYQPDRNAIEPNGTGDRMATFRLINGVTIQGGYAGFDHPDPNARDFELYETVLSGDLAGNDVDVNDPADLRDEPSRGENAYHVVTGSGRAESAVLDGLTITGGNANGNWPDPWPYEECGGGMYNKYLTTATKRDGIKYSATITDCKFVANSATIGGAMYNYYSNPKISNCSFSGNSVSWTCAGDYCWGGTGGAIYNEESSPMLTNCVFAGNSAPRGGGMFNNSSGPVVAFCTFTENSASFSDGGGMYNYRGGSRVDNCVFARNTAGNGGGMANQSSSVDVANCVFSENSAIGSGGGMKNTGGSSTISACVFVGNLSSNSRGGGMFNTLSNAMLTDCVLAGNSAKRGGGAVGDIRSQAIIVNCTFIQNRAGEAGGGVRCGYGSDGLLNSSILWGNSGPEGPQIAVDGTFEPATITVAYCLVMGGRNVVYAEPNDSLNWGEGNIDSDPCFADLGYWDPNGTPGDTNDDYWVMGDYHLKSQAGRYDPNEGGPTGPLWGWTIDEVTSPCIDAGDPISPIGLEPFPNGGRINMGAYGGTSEASKSYFGAAPCETIVAGDVNGDCEVNFLDFAIIAMHWLEEH